MAVLPLAAACAGTTDVMVFAEPEQTVTVDEAVVRVAVTEGDTVIATGLSSFSDGRRPGNRYLRVTSAASDPVASRLRLDLASVCDDARAFAVGSRPEAEFFAVQVECGGGTAATAMLAEVDPASGQVTRSVLLGPASTNSVGDLAALPDGRYLVTIGGSCAALAVVDMNSGIVPTTVKGAQDDWSVPTLAELDRPCDTTTIGTFASVAADPASQSVVVVVVSPGLPRSTWGVAVGSVSGSTVTFEDYYPDDGALDVDYSGGCPVLISATAERGYSLVVLDDGAKASEQELPEQSFTIAGMPRGRVVVAAPVSPPVPGDPVSESTLTILDVEGCPTSSQRRGP